MTAPSPTPDTGWLRLAVVFAVVTFIEAVGFGHYISFLPLLVTELGVSEAEVATTVGLLSAAALLVGLPLVPFWGVWADTYSRKLIVVRSALFESLLFVLLFFVTDVWQLFLLVPLVGLVLGNTGVMLAEITDRAPRARLGFAISLVGVSGPLGFAVGPALGGVLADQLGVRSLFIADAVLTGAMVALLVISYDERADRVRSTVPVLRMVGRSLLTVVRTPLARAIFAAYFLLLLGQRFLLPYLALYVRDLNGPVALATVVGLVAGLYGIAAAIGSPLAGALGDRVGYRRVFAAGVIVSALSLAAAAAVPGIVPFAVVYAAFGASFATASSMLFTMLAAGLPTTIRSSVLNLALAPLYLSGVLGALLSAGLIAASGGDLRPIWLISAAVVAVGLVPVWLLSRSESSQRGVTAA